MHKKPIVVSKHNKKPNQYLYKCRRKWDRNTANVTRRIGVQSKHKRHMIHHNGTNTTHKKKQKESQQISWTKTNSQYWTIWNFNK